ncbi:MAG: tRNA (cytidine(34)-2'-O)-methyltransferase [Alphaproteobacteria bacterium]|nr:tRNA (cytidine(34)-2'-O)-methyltransferase [Alphaproteobacteria bacterium]
MIFIKSESVSKVALRLALYQPDIPQNTGTLLRLAACVGLAVDIIEPCGFLFDDRRLRRSGMDYVAGVDLARHISWQAFLDARRGHDTTGGGRLVLLTTISTVPYTTFAFQPGDTVLVGREGSGVPEPVYSAADSRLCVPMLQGLRSLNVAVAASMVVGEALRQLEVFPQGQSEPGEERLQGERITP